MFQKHISKYKKNIKSFCYFIRLSCLYMIHFLSKFNNMISQLIQKHHNKGHSLLVHAIHDEFIPNSPSPQKGEHMCKRLEIIRRQNNHFHFTIILRFFFFKLLLTSHKHALTTCKTISLIKLLDLQNIMQYKLHKQHYDMNTLMSNGRERIICGISELPFLCNILMRVYQKFLS